MNVQRDPDAILGAWLEEGPTHLPDQTRRAISVNTRTNTQRRRSIWVPQRSPKMNPLARLAVMAVAVVAVLGGAIYLIGPGAGVGGPPASTASPAVGASPSPHITAVPSRSTPPSPSPSPSLLASGGDIFPGRYIASLDPSLTFTVEREVQHNCVPGYRCRGNIDSNSSSWLSLEFGEPLIDVQIIRVDKVDDPAKAGRLMDPPADLAAWIAGRPGVTVIGQKAASVGGLPAQQLDVRMGSRDVHVGPIPGVTDPPIGFGANTLSRLFVVDVRGHQILITLHATDGSIDELQPLVDSIVWN
ncbi:MAG: hypothetical protein ACJ77C_03075 [Chloroflexota bacterium]